MTSVPSPTSGAFRVCRGVALAVVSGALAAGAHELGGGGMPKIGVTAVLTVGVAAIGIALADRRSALPAILALLGMAQLATHVLLAVETMNMPGMHQDDGLAMVGAHTVAVLVSAVLLAKADAAVFQVIAALTRLLPTVLTTPPVPEAPKRPLVRVHAGDRATSVLLCRSNARRGPPVLV
ncbi:MAG TPA: hypothetical protein VHX38_19815 [Pseudonocardiaceae bacterium]|jgi:hypothetical protein|nr:hypothetical protein [Pseudonocardiaceae bacterium]